MAERMDLRWTKGRERQYDFHPWTVQKGEDPVTLVTRGEGVYFYDREGKRYLDLNAQLFNLNLGYGNRRVIEAIQRQAEELCYIGPSFATEAKIRLGQMMDELAPGRLTKLFLTNSGSESNEMALMMARLYTGRPKVLAKYRSYHGTTMGTLSVGGDPRRLPVGPTVPGTVRFFDPYCYRCSFAMRYPDCDLFCLKHIEEMIRFEDPDQIAAVIIEPVTGSNGAIVVPDGYLSRLREMCDRYGILLIADEVINGFGRTGEWFAVNHWEVVPDILVVAKGITSGYVPLGAAIVSQGIADYFEDTLLPIGCTYTGHPLACAAAVAAIEAYREGEVVENAKRMGAILMVELQRLKEKHPSVGEVRGLGLLACVELVKNRETREPLVGWNTPSDITTNLKQRMLEQGVFAYVRWNWIFIAPPLIIREEELQEGLTAVDKALDYADTQL